VGWKGGLWREGEGGQGTRERDRTDVCSPSQDLPSGGLVPLHKMTHATSLALMGTGRGVCHHLGNGLLSCSLKASYSTNQMTVSSLSLSLSVFWWTDPLRLSLSHLDSDEIFPRVAMLSLVRSASGGDSFQRLIAKYSQIILTLRVPEMFLERVS
jgi:hypothetical protein